MNRTMASSKLNVLSLFSGCGGLDTGFHEHPDFVIKVAVDAMPQAVEIYNANFQSKAQIMDVREFAKPDHTLDFVPDIIVGGPPCQDYSSAGKRQLGTRANLTTVYGDIIVKYKPRYFVMENVPNIKSVGKDIFEQLLENLRNAGYGLTIRVIKMQEYGVPQSRKRLFVLGERDREDDGFATLLDLAKAPVRSMREYMQRTGLDLGLGGLEYVYRHPRSYMRRGVFSIDELHPTVRGCRRNMPPAYKFHAGDKSLDRDMIANPTDRSIAMVQTFDSDFELSTKRGNALVIGNAVPPRFSKILAKIISTRHQGKK